MSPELEQLFHEVTELDAADRRRYLDAHCQDPALRLQLEQLLEYDRGAEEFLSAPVRKIAALIESDTPPTRAQRIGPYRIVRCLGRGGMGAVYEGERLDGELILRVAIKFVPIALQTSVMLERFRQERQIQANLNHPNISRVLDAGTTGDGSPYLVMELVDGKPVDVWCQERRCGPRRTVELFLKVCAAVQHAHQNLVIHRDLKPSNILVTSAGEPKLLDFGIAKLLDVGQAKEETIVRAWTPDYASPEQLAGRPMTTATDIYSLGCVLYNLLTGATPKRDADGQVALRGSAQNTAVDRDLDSILKHALDPEAECRYGTVQEMAEDLRRYLAYEPVLARPQGWIYVTRRFLWRKPLLSALLAGLAISVFAGTSLSLWQARRAAHRFEEVRGLANAFLFRFEEQIRDIPGTTAARQFVVNTALSYLERLAADSSGDPALKIELAAAYRKVSEVQFSGTVSSLGDTAGAMKSLARARELLAGMEGQAAMREEFARVLLGSGELEQESGELDEALRNSRRAQAVADGWLKGEPRNPAAMEIGSESAQLTGRVLRRLNHMDEARVSIERAVSIDRLALEREPQSEEWNLRIAADLGWLAGIEQARRQSAEAAGHQRDAVDILRNLKRDHGSSAAADRGLMVGLSRLASLLQSDRDRTAAMLEEALEYLEQAAAIARKRVSLDRQDTRALMDLQSVMTRQGAALLDAGRAGSAMQALTEAVGIARSLVERDSASREARLNLGIALGTQAEVLSATRAAANRQEARHVYLELLANHPSDAKVLYPYGYNQAALAKLLEDKRGLCSEGLAKLGGRTFDLDIESAYRNLGQTCGQ